MEYTPCVMVNGAEVVILASGKGLRLRPLSLDRPKALSPVCNQPLLTRLLKQLHAAGIQRAALTLPDAEKRFVELVRGCAPDSLKLDICCGVFTGSFKAALAPFGSPPDSLMVIYGDSLLSLDFAEFIRFHREVAARGGLATIVYHRPTDLTVPEKDGRTYHGVMSINGEGRVIEFLEKPRVDVIKPGFDLANAAVFICDRRMLEVAIRDEATDFSFHIFERAVKRRLPVYGYDIADGFRYDIGSVARLYEANIGVLRHDLRAPIPGREERPGLWAGQAARWQGAAITPPVLLGDEVFLGPGSTVGPDVVVGNGCTVGEHARIRESVIMEHCQIGSGSSIEKSVVGPDCKIGTGERVPPYSVLGAYSALGGDRWPAW